MHRLRPLKLATNSQLAERKKGWIDFDAGPIADGETIDDAAKRLLQLVIEVAGGKQTKAEEKGFREISILKTVLCCNNSFTIFMFPFIETPASGQR